MLERRDVYTLEGPWHPILRAYALAIGKMRDLPESDHRSLLYQAAVHGVGLPDDPPPDDFRSQCQHNCWYFLPWHRWYLHYFEQIVRSLLTEIDEVPAEVAEAWALPYWNYHRDGAAAIPFEFAQPHLWDGRDNPLYDDTRKRAVNERRAGVDPRGSIPLPGVLGQPFSSSDDAVPTFGGTDSGWHHFREPGAVAGGLEASPHNVVHGFVGGNMSDFSTAGLDPLFWLHHCNVDRYWEIKGHAEDPTGLWTDRFRFRDADGGAADVTSDGCVDSEGQLGYRYDDIERPSPPTSGLMARAMKIEGVTVTERSDLPPEPIAASGNVTLEGKRLSVPLELGPVSPAFRLARGDEAEPARVFLTVSEIRGNADPGISYGVYINEVVDERLAGIVSFFGIRGTVGGGHSLGYTFDVTDIVHELQDPEARINVLFEPIGMDAVGGPEAAAELPQVAIGHVGLLAH